MQGELQKLPGDTHIPTHGGAVSLKKGQISGPFRASLSENSLALRAICDPRAAQGAA